MKIRKVIDVTIGMNMSKLRKQFNLTQKEICSGLGINISTYKHYELGDRMVPISVLQCLAKFYKVSINYFFENMPELLNKYTLELSNYDFRISNDKTVDFKKITKGLKQIEEEIQAKIRLRIRKFRLENNKSLKELAKYLGINSSTYSKYEMGSRKISNAVIKKLAEYYNVSISDIVD